MKILNPDIIFNTINNGIIILDQDLNIIYWNRWCEIKTKLKESDILNKNICEQFPNIKESILKRKVKLTLSLNSPTFYSVNPHNYLIDIKINSITNKVYDSMQQSVTIVPYDIEQKYVSLYIYDDTALSTTNFRLSLALQELELYKNQLEDEVALELRLNKEKDRLIAEQSKLAAMGEMIGAIAHQWRQPLNALSGHIQFLEDDFDDKLVDKKYITKFVDKNMEFIKFMSNTIDDFRNFFRVDKKKIKFMVRQKVLQTFKIVQNELTNYDINLNINDGDFASYGFANEFQQVILNIINNSKDALMQNRIENKKIEIVIKETGIIEISDNAGGICEDIISRVFEPYFTTKDEGKGTGIGLYMSKKIIEDNMEGEITARNYKDGVLIKIKLNKGDES
ncbi:MAG: ATP-binding protein [Campylobacterota bacterium]|nr:ATP-binding protein [Campylobacterota bacterium]